MITDEEIEAIRKRADGKHPDFAQDLKKLLQALDERKEHTAGLVAEYIRRHRALQEQINASRPAGVTIPFAIIDGPMRLLVDTFGVERVRLHMTGEHAGVIMTLDADQTDRLREALRFAREIIS